MLPVKQKTDTVPDREHEQQKRRDRDQEPEPEPEPELEPAVTRGRARQLEEWWQRVTGDRSSDQLQPWWERQPEPTVVPAAPPRGPAAAAGSSSPQAESRIPRRVTATERRSVASVGRRSPGGEGLQSTQAATERRSVTSVGRRSPGGEGLQSTQATTERRSVATVGRRSPGGGVQPTQAVPRRRPISEGSLRLRLLKRDKEQVNLAREAVAARREAARPATTTTSSGHTVRPTTAATATTEKRQGKRCVSVKLSPDNKLVWVMTCI